MHKKSFAKTNLRNFTLLTKFTKLSRGQKLVVLQYWKKRESCLSSNSSPTPAKLDTNDQILTLLFFFFLLHLLCWFRGPMCRTSKQQGIAVVSFLPFSTLYWSPDLCFTHKSWQEENDVKNFNWSNLYNNLYNSTWCGSSQPGSHQLFRCQKQVKRARKILYGILEVLFTFPPPLISPWFCFLVQNN